MSSQRELTINVVDVNDNPPNLIVSIHLLIIYSQYFTFNWETSFNFFHVQETSFTVLENQELFVPFENLRVTDADEEQNALPYYTIIGKDREKSITLSLSIYIYDSLEPLNNGHNRTMQSFLSVVVHSSEFRSVLTL